MTSVECAKALCRFFDACPAKCEASCRTCFKVRNALLKVEGGLVDLEAWK